MSEPLLKAIIQLFAIVAKEDDVTRQERDQIEAFLKDHLNKNAVRAHLEQFDEYSKTILTSGRLSVAEEQQRVNGICERINTELTQKQKVVIILELMGIILADGHISVREEELVHTIGKAFNILNADVDRIKMFVLGESPSKLSSDHILIIDGKDYGNTATFKHLKKSSVDGFIAILHLDTVDAYFIKYLGSSDVFLNGVPLISGSKMVLAIGATIKTKNNPIYYGDVVGQFIKNTGEKRITFEAKNISYKFKTGKLGLREINISEESGRLIGLMGASGAGKSTLLNVLNGTDKPTEGEVLINNINIHKNEKQLEGVIGFVPQDDLLIEELSVYQNLYYAAKLCFDHLSDEEIKKRVVVTLDNLGLLETKDLKVGSPLDKTISGGQRKRLNIGLELLREPSVLFVDEPTSGLSSRDSENIMDLLKELSLKGKLVFVVIHQPSSDIFKMFDKLLILDTGGYQIFYGNPVEAVVYFKETISMINSDQGECHECGNVNPEQIFNIIETKVINEYGNFTNERKILPEQWNQFYKERNHLLPIKPAGGKPLSTLSIPNKLKQLWLFSIRDVLSKLSNKQYLLINLLEAPILAFLLAYIVRYYNTDASLGVGYLFSKNINLPAYLFMSVIVALFMGLTVSAEEIIRDRKILKREAFLHLSRSSYIASKLLILFTLSAIQTLAFVLIGNSILGIEDMFLRHWLILFTASCMANVLGLNISSAFNSAVTIYIVIPILLIPQLILSGVVVKFDKLNPSLTETGEVPLVGNLMASRWAFEAGMVSQFKDNPFESQFYPYEKIIANADYKKIYYIPTLKSKLEYNLNNMGKRDDPAVEKKILNNFKLLSNEIGNELRLIGEDKYTRLESLTIDKFDSATYRYTDTFLNKLRNFYATQYNNADAAKDEMIVALTNTPEKMEAFEQFRNRYYNEAVSEIVRNQNEPHRILESGPHLVQKIYPIYKDPQPSNPFDYNAQFYVATKHFLGGYFDTYWFNVTVIWLMSLLLAFTLYFDLFRKIINTFSGLSDQFKKIK